MKYTAIIIVFLIQGIFANQGSLNSKDKKNTAEKTGIVQKDERLAAVSATTASTSQEIRTKDTYLGKVTENGIRVREEKNSSAKVLGNLYKGEKIEILERSEKKEKIQEMEEYWYKIELKGKLGWVYGYYLIVEEPIDNLKGTIKENNVHIRKEFDLGTEIMGKVFKGESYTVISRTNKPLPVDDKKDFWYRIVLPNNTKGWIFGEFIELVTGKTK